MLAIWPIVLLWLVRASLARQIQRGIVNWSSAPQVWYDPVTKFYRRLPVYDHNHEAKTSSRAVPLQNRPVFKNWNIPKATTLSGLASQFEKDANRRRYVPRVWSSTNLNLLQRRLSGPQPRSAITATVLRPAKINGSRHNVYQYWNHPSQGPHERSVSTPKRGVLKTNFPFQPKYDIRKHENVARKSDQRPVYGADDYSPSWSGQTTNLSDNRFDFSRNNVRGKKSSSFVGQNGFRKAHNLRRNWIPFKPGTFIPSYGYTPIKRNFPVIMPTRVDRNPYGQSISPRAPSWLFTMQRNRIPQIRKMRRIPARALISSSGYERAAPGLTIPGLTNNYLQREFAKQRKLELESSQDLNNAYESSDNALQNLLGEINLKGSNLISESALNQPASSSSGYRTSAAEKEWRLVPRTSSGITSYMRKESKLTDPKLIRLSHILRNMKKRSLNSTKADSNDNLSKYALGRTGILYDSNDARFLDKRNADDEKEKRSSIRKTKGRWNWGILNEFAPNVRLASMILLKQKRQDMRKRALQQPDDPDRNSSAKIMRGRSTSTSKIESASTVLKKEKEKPPSLTPENVSSNKHHAHHPSKRKKIKHKHARNFININGGGMYFNTRKGYLNRQFSPLQDNAASERYEPFFNTRGPFQASQMAMAERMPAMRSHGLFHSLGNINPQFFLNSPFRFPLMPVSQRYMAMQQYGLPAGNFPSEYKRPAFPPTQNSFGMPWSMGVPNRMTETQGAETEEVEKATLQDSSDQASISQTNEGFKTSISSLVGKGNNAENFQSPTTAEESSQILKIENNGTFEGQPIVNAESFDANSQGPDEKATNLQLTGMEVSDQSATMLNKWYPLRNGKVSLLSDPRKYTSQWPSRLPGLDSATSSNDLHSEDDFPAIRSPGIFNTFFQKNDQNHRSPPSEDNVFNEGYVGVKEFMRGSETPLAEPSVTQRFNFNGTSDQEYFPTQVPYSTFPFWNSLHKREDLRGKRHANEYQSINRNVFNGSFSHGRKSSLQVLDTNEKNNSTKKASGIRFRLNGTEFHKKKAVSVANKPRTQIIYPVGDPMNEIIRKGYSEARGLYGAGISSGVAPWPFPYTPVAPQPLSSRVPPWPLSFTPVAPQLLFRRFPLLAFPKGSPQSLMELSQKVDRFPTQDFDTSRPASEISNVPPGSPWQDKRNEPNSLSTALNLFSSQEPLESSEKPSVKMLRGERSEENEVHQKGSSSSSYSLNANGFPEISQQSIPGFTSQSYTEFPEETAQPIPENEQFERGDNGLPDGEEPETEAEKSIDDGERNEGEESDSSFTPGLVDGLDTMQTGLLKQQFDGTPSFKGRVMDIFHTLGSSQGERGLSSPESLGRRRADLQQNAMAPQKALLRERATFSTKQDIQQNVPGSVEGNLQGLSVSEGNRHMLNLPNLSLNSIEKAIDSADGEQTTIGGKTGSGHSYGSRRMGEAEEKLTDDNISYHGSPFKPSPSKSKIHDIHTGNGKHVHSLDWKSSLLNSPQAPFDFNWKLERALTQWKDPADPGPNLANMRENLADDTSQKVFVNLKGSNDNPEVVPGYTFDTQGQRSGPLFLPNAPPEIANDSNAETVLMVSAPGNKAKEEQESTKSGAKKHTISGKTSGEKALEG